MSKNCDSPIEIGFCGAIPDSEVTPPKPVEAAEVIHTDLCERCKKDASHKVCPMMDNPTDAPCVHCGAPVYYSFGGKVYCHEGHRPSLANRLPSGSDWGKWTECENSNGSKMGTKAEPQQGYFKPKNYVEGEALPDRIWIAAYTAGDKSGVLAKGLHFRSIHDSKEDAEFVKIYPNALGPVVQEYVKAQPQQPAHSFEEWRDANVYFPCKPSIEWAMATARAAWQASAHQSPKMEGDHNVDVHEMVGAAPVPSSSDSPGSTSPASQEEKENSVSISTHHVVDKHGMIPAPLPAPAGEAKTEIDPCPFCGSEPEETHANDLSYFYVACCNEDCPAHPETGLQGNAEKARKEWNWKDSWSLAKPSVETDKDVPSGSSQAKMAALFMASEAVVRYRNESIAKDALIAELLNAAKESLLYTDCQGECDQIEPETYAHNKLRQLLERIESNDK